MEILVPFGGPMPSSSIGNQQQQRAGMKRKIRDDDWVYDDYKDCSLRLIRRNDASPSSSRVSAAVDGGSSRVPTTDGAPSSSSRVSMAVDRAFSMVPTTEGAPSSSSRVCWQHVLPQPAKHGQKRKDRDWSEGSVHRRDHDDLAADDEDSSIGLLVCPCQVAYDQALAAQMGW